MARSRYKFFESDYAPYFLTATIINWLPLFTNPDIAAIVFDSLKYLIENNNITLFGYVLMENHIHMVASAPELSDVVARFKSYTARKSIDTFIQHNNDFILHQLTEFKLKHKHDRTYQFWQEGSHPQRIENELMMIQKLEYIHNNPVRRGYVDFPEQWRYSSARNYAGVDGLLPVTIEW